jgi:hypothetical protein
MSESMLLHVILVATPLGPHSAGGSFESAQISGLWRGPVSKLQPVAVTLVTLRRAGERRCRRQKNSGAGGGGGLSVLGKRARLRQCASVFGKQVFRFRFLSPPFFATFALVHHLDCIGGRVFGACPQPAVPHACDERARHGPVPAASVNGVLQPPDRPA